MPAVSSPTLRTLGESARRAWKKLKQPVPTAEYLVKVRNQPLICWTNIGGVHATLNTMHVHRENDSLRATYLQVSKHGETVRSMSRSASIAELERWFNHYPEDRKMLDTQEVV